MAVLQCIISVTPIMGLSDIKEINLCFQPVLKIILPDGVLMNLLFGLAPRIIIWGNLPKTLPVLRLVLMVFAAINFIWIKMVPVRWPEAILYGTKLVKSHFLKMLRFNGVLELKMHKTLPFLLQTKHRKRRRRLRTQPT